MRETLISNFLRISKIPRESGKEDKIANFFIDVAKENNLLYFKDDNNNVLIKKKGNINSSPVALQSHLDMVCIKKEDSKHNFETEGINVVISDDKVTAKDTTLGADQGVGLAIMLTIMENKSLKHPDLEFLFTTEEETTFNGAVTFPYDKVTSKRLINLDNSKDDSVFIGSDGDICNEYIYNGNLVENNMPSYKVLLNGFLGGNSSEDINLSKNNAIFTMARILHDKDVLLKNINGGISENDIATFCEVTLNTKDNIDKIFEGYNVKVSKIESDFSFSKEDTKNIINQIINLKSGFINKEMVSANLGLIKTIDNKITIYYLLRSMDKKKLETVNKETKNLNYNFSVNEVYTDSSWEVNYESKLLNQYKKLYYREYLEYPKEEVYHGSIECSAIKKRIKGLDIISIGGNIEKFHTILETTYISSWLKIYNLLIKFLESL